MSVLWDCSNVRPSRNPAKGETKKMALTPFALPSLLGPLTAGRYIQISLGLGFYVPEEDFNSVQALANATGRVQFLGITKAGAAIVGASRDELLTREDSAGLVAWIVPQRGGEL